MSPESTGKQARRVRIGKYEVLAHIATGGMGAVYRGIDTDLNRAVALKVLSPEIAAKPNMLARFRREARNAALLHHENIVSIYECGEHDGTHFLALEFVEGKDLHTYVGAKGRLQPEEARQILIQAARALDHAHYHRIIHRDIKPSNFLIGSKEGALLVKLADFGLARQMTDEEMRVTRIGTTMGTVDFMAPEQARNSQAADIRSDIYSLGCTFYYMLTGQCPFPRGSMPERIMQHIEAEPADVRTFHPNISAGLVSVLRRMLAKKPADRYQTPHDLLVDLENPERLQDPIAKSEQIQMLAELAKQENPVVRRAPQRGIEPEKGERAAPVPVPWEKRPAHLRRRRDQTEGEQEQEPERRWPAWWPIAACAAGLVILTAVLLSQIGSESSGTKDKKLPETDPNQVRADKPSPVKERPTPPKEPPEDPKSESSFVGPAEPEYARFFKPTQFDVAAWSREVFGPFGAFPSPPTMAKLVRVGRLALPGQYASIAEALSQTEGALIIEIHDNGPLFERSLPPIAGRALTLRAGAGYRPLVAWDLPVAKKSETGNAAVFMALADGSLTLENLDVVGKGSADGPESPCFFRIQDGHFYARDCTFSIAGKHPRGIRLTELVGSPVPGAPRPLQFRMSRCLARGSDLVTATVKGAAAEILFDGSLVVEGNRPILDISNPGDEAVTLRLVRTTLVTRQEMCRWRAAEGTSPKLNGLVWDSLLARAWPPAAPAGDMLVLEAGDAKAISWKAVNSVYAGWKRLLHSTDKIVAGNSLADWRLYFRYKDGDHAVGGAWPAEAVAAAEVEPVRSFATFGTPVCFGASAGSGVLGCTIGALPAEPTLWLKRTYDWFALDPPALSDNREPPPIPQGGGVYHGERIDVSKNDPGSVLQNRLETGTPGPRLVLHLAGNGKHAIKPIRVQGIKELVLYFEPAREKEEPLTLLAQQRPQLAGGALIDVEDGSLQIIGGRFQLENKKHALVPAHLIRVRGGDLFLERCHLQGPLDSAPEAFQSLIRLEPAASSNAPPVFLCKDSVLVSAKKVVHLLHPTASLRLKNCVALALDDALVLDPGLIAKPGLFLWLEQSTFANRRAVLSLVEPGLSAESWNPVIVEAKENYFLDPFGKQTSVLWRFSAAALASGRLAWQGKDNAFDADRFQGFFAQDSELGPQKQSIREWQRIWGALGDADIDVVAAAKDPRPFVIDPPALDRLALPASLRPRTGRPPYGADLFGLGILKKR